jgi:hypothetical protein
LLESVLGGREETAAATAAAAATVAATGEGEGTVEAPGAAAQGAAA